MHLTTNQIIAVVMVILGVLVGSTAQLTDLLGPASTKTIVSLASLANTMLSGIMVVLTGQSAQVKSVIAMPGIEKITVNSQASPTLAQIAVDPAVNKISPTPAALDDVTATANAANG